MSRTISHYQIVGELGRGGMGVVYKAVDTRLGRAVAIKMLPAEATADPERNRRFVQEARAASALNHPHIVTVHDIDEHDGAMLIAMELVEGTPLDRLIAAGPLPVVQALELAIQVAGALQTAHASGIVHRDIKPANIMVTQDGRAKVLDFGLAKLAGPDGGADTRTALATRPGIIMGTAAYMSPEQADGRTVDPRSDIFSFGAVLYEALTGRRAFAGHSDLNVITAILRDHPTPLRRLRAEVPADVQAIVDRCLAKDPGQRYPHAGALRQDLVAALAHLTAPGEARWRRPAVLVPIAALLLALAGFGIRESVKARRVRWVQQQAIPEIERLQDSQRRLDAVRLAREAERFAPDAVRRVRERWMRWSFVTEPAGAEIAIREYLDPDAAWEPIGRSPVENYRLPVGAYRVRATKPGFTSLEVSRMPGPTMLFPIRLTPERETEPGMVLVGGGPVRVGVAGTVTLPDFWLDRLEVTNRDFKRFVDAGGYNDAKYWREPFLDGSRILAFDEAMSRFRDATGRAGPATWELGSYPEGQADYPVAGISWFEAAAYARFAGKSLPSLYHWYRAAPMEEGFADILRHSNIDGKDLVKAGERQGLGPWGTLDMAGNVKEWCQNEVEGADLRYILGGGWDEPSYRYAEAEARNPWQRLRTYGARLVKNLGPADAANVPVARVTGDPKSVVPLAAGLLEAYKRFYAYDRTPLDARTIGTDDDEPHWRKETIEFDAAYGGERIPAHLFLPRNVAPPFQTIVLFPSAYALYEPSSQNLDYGRFDFIVRSGRAVLYPVYQGTYERQKEIAGASGQRDLHVQWAKDFFRSVDYLETRQDIAIERLAYYSLSMGAFFGPIPVSLEPRIKAAVFASGGVRFNYPPEIQPANFAPHVKVPVLMVNGRDDFQAPLESQRRLFELLGTPPEHKVHLVLDGGHVPQDHRSVIKAVLDFFDKYLGPVAR